LRRHHHRLARPQSAFDNEELPRMDRLFQDIRFAVRTLLKRPAFTAAVVLTLGLGIAANTAIFSVANAVLLHPLPFEQADRLVTPNPISYRGFGISLSIPNYYDWKEKARSWESFGAYRGGNAVLTGIDRPEVVQVRQVLGDFFTVLGIEAARGRLIDADEAEPGALPIAVITDGFWRNRLGGADDALGSAITLDGVPHTVVGILPPGLEFPSPNDEVFIPMGLFAEEMSWGVRGSSSGTRAIARLAEGVTLEQAQADLDGVVAGIQAEEDENAATAELIPLTELYVGDVRASVLILMGAVGLVMLIACANVANLLLVRGEGRQRELAVRTALGAGRSRVLRQLLTESVLLGIAGGIVGVGIAAIAISGMVNGLPDDIPALVAQRIGMDANVLLFTLGLSLATGLLFGFAPALRSVRPDIVATLKEGGRGGTGGERRRLSSGLVIAEIGLSLMLLAGAGLLVKSLGELHDVEKGFDETNVLTARIPLPESKYDTEEKWRAFYTELTERTKALPGVQYASVSQIIPLAGNSWETGISPEGVDPFDDDLRDSVLYYIADVDHFDVLGIDLLRGRPFDERDIVGAQPVVIVDETMAEKYWPGEDPIGKRITMEMEPPEGDPDGDPVPLYRTVIGIARHVRHYEIEETSRIEAYLPFHQTPRRWRFGGYLMVKTASDPAEMVSMVRREVEAMDADQPMMLVRTLSDVVAARLSTYSAMRGLLVIFSSLALLLAAVGIYGVMSFSVAERSREIGIRMALGAERSSVLGMVCGQGLRLTALGLAAGLSGALLVTRWLQATLYGIGTTEPATLLTVSAILGAVALSATYFPAHRATRVDPAIILRDE
jgi:putative ABC transport system permease protein